MFMIVVALTVGVGDEGEQGFHFLTLVIALNEGCCAPPLLERGRERGIVANIRRDRSRGQ